MSSGEEPHVTPLLPEIEMLAKSVLLHDSDLVRLRACLAASSVHDIVEPVTMEPAHGLAKF